MAVVCLWAPRAYGRHLLQHRRKVLLRLSIAAGIRNREIMQCSRPDCDRNAIMPCRRPKCSRRNSKLRIMQCRRPKAMQRCKQIAVQNLQNVSWLRKTMQATEDKEVYKLPKDDTICRRRYKRIASLQNTNLQNITREGGAEQQCK